MRNCCRTLVLGLALVLSALTAGRAQDAKIPPAKAVLDLATQAEAGKDVSKGTAALKSRFGGVRAAMNVFNPTYRGGIGYGPKGSGIERKLEDLSEKALDPEQLKKESAELRRVAHVNLVMADVIVNFAPRKAFLGRGKKEWERDVEDVKKASQDLLKAVKDSDPKAVKAAAGRIYTACNRCHDGTP